MDIGDIKGVYGVMGPNCAGFTKKSISCVSNQ